MAGNGRITDHPILANSVGEGCGYGDCGIQSSLRRAELIQVVQIIGPVVDVEFPGHVPSIYNAVRITSEGFNVPEPLIVEVPA